MGLLILESRNTTAKNTTTRLKFESGQKNCMYSYKDMCQIQNITCQINEHPFSFIYCRTTPNREETRWIKQTTANSQYLMGDLNLDPAKHDQKNKLQSICNKVKKSLLNETTTNNKVQLDHILGIEKEGVAIFTTSFVNFISDHKSITIRISGSGSKFVKDQRLPKSYEDDLAEMDVEVESSEEDSDSLKMPPPPTPPTRKRRHSESKAKGRNQ